MADLAETLRNSIKAQWPESEGEYDPSTATLAITVSLANGLAAELDRLRAECEGLREQLRDLAEKCRPIVETCEGCASTHEQIRAACEAIAKARGRSG